MVTDARFFVKKGRLYYVIKPITQQGVVNVIRLSQH